MSVALVLMNVNKFAIMLMAATSACVIQAMCCQELDTVVMVQYIQEHISINFSSYTHNHIYKNNIMITLYVVF